MSDDEDPKPQRRGGRPSKYDPKFCDRVLELGAEGRSRVQIAARLGVSKGTLYNWEEAHAEFAEAVEEAEDLAQAWWEDCGQAGLDRRDFNSQAYSFQMKNRFKAYREVQTHQLTGPDGMPLTEQPSSSDLTKALMFLFGEGTVVVPKPDQENGAIEGPELNGVLSVGGDGGAPHWNALRVKEQAKAPVRNEPVEPAPQEQPRPSALHPGEREIFESGAEIMFVKEFQKFGVYDAGGRLHGYRRNLEDARALASALKAPPEQKGQV